MCRLGVVLFFMALSVLPVLGAQIQLGASASGDLEYVPGEVVVRTRPVRQTGKQSVAPVSAQSNLLSAISKTPVLAGSVISKVLHKSGCCVVKLPVGVEVEDAVNLLQTNPEVAWAEPVYLVRPLSISAPNDYYWGRTYTDDVVGFPEISWPYMWNMPRIQALEGWNIWPGKYYTAATKPVNAVKVGVIDTGIDPDHPDFVNFNGGSSDSASGGQINWSLACKFITDTANPSEPTFAQGVEAATDAFGHGTHVAGILAAAGNNAEGVIGVGYNSQIVPVRIFTTDSAGRLIGRDDDLAYAIRYCADQNLPIINLSVGTTSYSYLIAEAINYAYYKGCLVIAAANEGESPSTLGKMYPAANSKVLAVSPTGIDDEFASGYAGSGDYIGISAPSGAEKIFTIDFGDETYFDIPWYTPIWATVPTYGAGMSNAWGYPLTDIYGHEIGTSMATPHVSGLAALYADMKGYSTSTHGSNLAIWRAIQRGADNPYGGSDLGYSEDYGFGRINVFNTLSDLNARGATVGSASGQVFSNSYPTAGVPIKITKVGTTTCYQTTTADFGLWRIPNIPAGTYSVKNIGPVALTKEILYVDIVPGCDTPGLDLYLGPVDYQLDDTSPSSPEVIQDIPVGNTLHVKWWSADLESGIFKYEVAIGTTPGGQDVLTWTNQGWRTEYTFNISSASGKQCYVSVRSTNGAGLVSSATSISGHTISAGVNLGNYTASPVGVPVRIELLTLEGETLRTDNTTLDASSMFHMQDVLPGTYKVAIKPSHWLRKVTGPVTVEESDLEFVIK